MEKIKWSTVKTWREAGIEAKWGKYQGGPAMFIKPSHSKSFFLLDQSALDAIQASVDKGNTLKQAVDEALALCDVFNIPAH